MKTLQNNFLEAYKEAVQSIKAEGKTSRLCRFYCYTIDEEGATLDSALINVSISTTLNETELMELFIDNEKHSRTFKTEQDAINHMEKKLAKGSKSTFFYMVH